MYLCQTVSARMNTFFHLIWPLLVGRELFLMSWPGCFRSPQNQIFYLEELALDSSVMVVDDPPSVCDHRHSCALPYLFYQVYICSKSFGVTTFFKILYSRRWEFDLQRNDSFSTKSEIKGDLARQDPWCGSISSKDII